MAFDLNTASAWIIKMVVNPLLWLLILVFVVGVLFVFLKIRKKRRLCYTALEYVINDNKVKEVNIRKAGFIGKKLWFKGMWWTGREVMRDDTDDEILEFSDEDFIFIDGKKGVAYYRDPINTRKVPLNRLRVNGEELVAQIPPASYIDASIDIIKDANLETTDTTQKIVFWAVMGGVIVFALVSVILIVQMIKSSQAESSKLVLEAGKTCLESAKSVCQTLGSTGSTTAP